MCYKDHIFAFCLYKLQFIGERMRKGSALDPHKELLKKFLMNPQNFQKRVKFHQFSH
jgi:hypothetical protein